MEIPSALLKKVLIELDFLSAKEFEKTLRQAKKEKKSLEEFLISHDIVSDQELGHIIAEDQGYRFVNLRKESIPDEILKIVPEVVAKKQEIIAFGKDAKGLHVAMAHPENLDIQNFLAKKTGFPIISYYATHNDLKEALSRYKKGIEEEFERIIERSAQEAIKEGTKPEDIAVVKIVDTLLAYAYENRASDIHIEPYADKTVVRFRIDGILHDVVVFPSRIHNLIVSRIKILAKLRTDEHRAAQDGKLRFESNGQQIDVRVSIVPIEEGEKTVLRILSERARRYTLEELGMRKKDLETIKNQLKRPHGMILATGPTGCGKTTTMYAILKILNTRDVNITTIEDPVEYDIEGVNQIQVNPRTNLTFAKGLKSIVRQDPDIIMVGEIRDVETAGIAVNAALTGHLVLSTLHTNDAPTTLPRLIDMKVEPFLIASTVYLVIAQRLVRKICPKCIYSYEISRGEFLHQFPKEIGERVIGPRKKVRFFRGKGCSACHGSGYSGRTGIFELMEMNDDLRYLVKNRATSDELRAAAIKSGMTTMLEDGLEKAFSGTTSLEEVLKVTLD